MAFRHSFLQHLIDLQSDICDGNDIQNAASQLNETIDVSAFKVLIEKFDEQSSDVSPTFRYWQMFLEAIELVHFRFAGWTTGKIGISKFSAPFACNKQTELLTLTSSIYIGHA